MSWEGNGAVTLRYDGLRCLWCIHFKMWKKIDFYCFIRFRQLSSSCDSVIISWWISFVFILFSYFDFLRPTKFLFPFQRLSDEPQTVLDVYTLMKTKSGIFIHRIYNQTLFNNHIDHPWFSRPYETKKEKHWRGHLFDEMKHVSIVHVCSCLLCIKKDYIAMCVMFDKYTCFAAGLM